MAAKILPHTRLEDRHIPFRMQPAAVDDANASVAMTPVVDELLYLRDSFRGGLGVQIEPAAWGVVSAPDPSELAPIDTRRDVTVFRFCLIVMMC